ncbi:Alpha/Beta hydrolase protein [Scheffersomyces xylosifermentans]|uniref:Alpha/Beta hydrolase protein n=1 Tax=Scheffersomyces xylosifermentans TaxID=1304137 RepID=UPI00315D0E2E
MKLFEFDPESFSKEKFVVGGINTYVYNSSVLQDYVSSFNNKTKVNEIPIYVHYLVHHRQGDYTYTEATAYNVLKQFYAKKEKVDIPLICVTFDNRNHGERLVDTKSNSSWKSGNDTHAVDMISSIEGNIADLKLIMEFLPSYLNLDYYVSEDLKKEYITDIRFRNILSGYSLGGHTIIRFANRYPDLVEIINPVVGCNDMSSLLINRLNKRKEDSNDFYKKYFYFHYKELEFDDDQKKKYYPESFHKLVSRQDQEIFENFPMTKIKMFAAYGADDQLVPTSLSRVWAELYDNTNEDTEIFIQEGVGHDCTPEMIERFTTWLAKQI